MHVIRNPNTSRVPLVAALGLALLCVGFLCVGEVSGRLAQQMPTAEVQDEFLSWPLPPGAEEYADIDGRRIHRTVTPTSSIKR